MPPHPPKPHREMIVNQIASLIWKEWQESQPLLWIGLGVFLGLPIIGGLEATLVMHKHFELFASQWVLDLGAVLAVFVAVGATCRDLAPKLEDFWRSRPIRVSAFFAVKYAVGLAVVLLACLPPLAAELLFNRIKAPAATAIAWLPFSLAVCFSLGFAAGCIIRRTAHAAAVALAGVLLLYLLPVVLPSLQSFGIGAVSDLDFYYKGWPTVLTEQLAIFAGGMLAIAVVLPVAAVIAVRRQWHAEAGQRTMYAAIASVLLLVLVIADYQVGTNLPLLAQAKLPPDEYVVDVRTDGHRGVLTGWRFLHTGGTEPHHYLHTLEITANEVVLSPPREIPAYEAAALGDMMPWRVSNAVSPHPGINYSAEFGPADPISQNEVSTNLVVRDLSSDNPMQPELVIQLWNVPTRAMTFPILRVRENRLYVVGRRLMVFDITHPSEPKLIFSASAASALNDFAQRRDGRTSSGVAPASPRGDGLTLALPQAPQLSDNERLQLACAAAFTWSQSEVFDGTFLCATEDGKIEAYRLETLTAQSAHFQKLGEYRQTLLESLFGSFNYSALKLQNGRLYVGGWFDRGSMFNSHITVFDLTGKYPLRPVGHFGAPGASTVFPLPDGRALVGGSSLWLVGSPARRG